MPEEEEVGLAFQAAAAAAGLVVVVVVGREWSSRSLVVQEASKAEVEGRAKPGD